tara:strand:- start:144 stop:590 length:447 start_codon:yes stop_codon:yes gene_type:complete
MELTVKEFHKPTYTKDQFRSGIMALQEKLLGQDDVILPDSDINPLNHTFTEKQYIREIKFPKGELLVTKIHKVQHPFFLLKGEISFLTEEGETRISAPYYGVTNAGTKRVIYVHEDTIFVTVHPTSSKDLDEIEEELIAKDYNELESV